MKDEVFFDVQRFSVHDGPGIRTTFFFKGCTLTCKWCHNPEGLSAAPQLMYFDEKCISCGDCLNRCPQAVHKIVGDTHTVDFLSCIACGKCEIHCPSRAVKIVGREYSVEEILEEALKDKAFYGKNGGITFSGGEPMRSALFLAESLKLLKGNGINTAVDTAGNVSYDSFKEVIPCTDVFLYDIKGITEKLHMLMTGQSNKQILENYLSLVRAGCEIYVRIPVVGGYNATLAEITLIADFLKENYSPNVKQILLIPYHKLGQNKYLCIGKEYPCTDEQIVSKEEMQSFAEIFIKHKLPLFIV